MSNPVNNIGRYVIVGNKRSGTTVTHLCLHGHPNVAAVLDEVRVSPLFTQGMGVFTVSGDKYLSAGEEARHHRALFDAISGLEADENTLAQGLKVTVMSPRETAEFVACLQKHFPDMLVIYVVRDDLIAQYGSAQRVHITGQAHSWRKASLEKEVSFEIPKAKFVSYARNCLAVTRELDKLKQTHQTITVSYENDILAGNYDTYYKIFRLLNLPNVDISWLRSEKVAKPAAEYITNYAELQQVLTDVRNNVALEDGRAGWPRSLGGKLRPWKQKALKIRAILQE